MARASLIPCVPLTVFQTEDAHRGKRPNETLLTVSCRNWLSNPDTCRGACANGHKASVEFCESCADYQYTTPPSMAARAAQFAATMMSKVTSQQATPEQQAVRIATCRSCAHLKPAENPDDVGWCGACGCPTNALTLLRVKAKILHPSCPKGYWKPLSQETITMDQLREIKPLSE